MNRILIHHDMGGDVYYVVDTAAQLDETMRHLYRLFAGRGHFDYLEKWHPVYKAAAEGDFKAIQQVLKMRQGARHESWTILTAVDVTVPNPVKVLTKVNGRHCFLSQEEMAVVLGECVHCGHVFQDHDARHSVVIDHCTRFVCEECH